MSDHEINMSREADDRLHIEAGCEIPDEDICERCGEYWEECMCERGPELRDTYDPRDEPDYWED